MLPLPRLRLPSRSELEIFGLFVLVFFAAAYLREREKVATRDALLAARPALEEHRAIKEEKGPSVTTRKFGPPPAPTPACPRPQPVLLEETISEGPSKREELVDRKETPMGLPRAARTRYVGLSCSPDAWDRPRVSAGLTFMERLDAGAYFDSRYSAFGLETRYRF